MFFNITINLLANLLKVCHWVSKNIHSSMGCNKHKKVGESQYNASYKSTLDWLSIYYNYST